MPLTPKQVIDLAVKLDQQWDVPTLSLFADGLGVRLGNLAPNGTLKEQAFKFIDYMNNCRPPRDGELLEELQRQGNASLRAEAAALLTPTFYSSTGHALDAVVLGKAAFVDRDALRLQVRAFMNPSPYTTRVLIVRGDQVCGKTYTWEFLRHLAVSAVGAVPRRLRLENARYTPRQLFEQVGNLLLLDQSGLPTLSDKPQLARIHPLINWFKGQMVKLARPYWLVIDDLNDPRTTPDMREAVYALAYAVEESRPDNLWVALLGYNTPVTDPDLRHTAQEDAQFPDAATVAKHFEIMAKGSPLPLTRVKALQIADVLFAKYARLDKESMIQITSAIERIGEKLRLGIQP